MCAHFRLHESPILFHFARRHYLNASIRKQARAFYFGILCLSRRYRLVTHMRRMLDSYLLAIAHYCSTRRLGVGHSRTCTNRDWGIIILPQWTASQQWMTFRPVTASVKPTDPTHN
jgi:hypothetical protein